MLKPHRVCTGACVTGTALFTPELPALNEHKPMAGLGQRGSFRGNPRKTWGRRPGLFTCVCMREYVHTLVCVCLSYS